MDNSGALSLGAERAKNIIARHTLNKVLVPMAESALQFAVNKRIRDGHNMTGNTVNAYAVGAFVKGRLVYMRGSWQSIPRPLRNKLHAGQRFRAGSQRWDEEIQGKTFKAKVDTSGHTEPEKALEFIQSYQAPTDQWSIVVCNGVEYASYQEAAMGIDTLTEAYNDFSFSHRLHFTPIPD